MFATIIIIGINCKCIYSAQGLQVHYSCVPPHAGLDESRPHWITMNYYQHALRNIEIPVYYACYCYFMFVTLIAQCSRLGYEIQIIRQPLDTLSSPLVFLGHWTWLLPALILNECWQESDSVASTPTPWIVGPGIYCWRVLCTSENPKCLKNRKWRALMWVCVWNARVYVYVCVL